MTDFLNQKFEAPSPLERIGFQYRKKSFEIYVKRDDLIHFIAGGNKWRKLIGHPAFNSSVQKLSILSTGGNFSNLVFAISYLCYINGHSLTVLSPETNEDSYLMVWARKLGVQFQGLNRSQLRDIRKGQLSPFEFVEEKEQHLWIPEGGGGEWSEVGIRLLIKEIEEDLKEGELNLITAAGTGITAFYMAENLPISWNLLVFPAIQSKVFNQYLQGEFKIRNRTSSEVQLISQKNDKGIGSVSGELLEFLLEFYQQTAILLDPFYNGKALFYALQDGKLLMDDKPIVLVHSGGTQAWYGLAKKFTEDRRIQTMAKVFVDQFRNSCNLVFED